MRASLSALETHLRRAPAGSLFDRSHRSVEEPDPGERRSNHRHPHARAKAATPGQKDHRRLDRYRTSGGRTQPGAVALTHPTVQVNETKASTASFETAAQRASEEQYVLRLYIAGTTPASS